jgi:GTP-dependent phosphoenolpyruvate carboxykinase
MVVELHCWLAPSYSYLCRTKKADVARVEKRTFICSPTRDGAKPTPREGIKSKLGHWMAAEEMDAKMDSDFAGCMKGVLPSQHLEIIFFCFVGF